jgi:hypothetical protein
MPIISCIQYGAFVAFDLEDLFLLHLKISKLAKKGAHSKFVKTPIEAV